MPIYLPIKDFSNYRIDSRYLSTNDKSPADSVEINTLLNYQNIIIEQIKTLGITRHPQSVIEDDVFFDGNILVNEGVTIMSGTRIKGNVIIGKNTTIGNNCLIRGNCSIGENNRVGFATDIKNTVTGDHTHVGPSSFVGDSIIGDNGFIGACVRTSNFRLDRKNIWIHFGDEKIDTKKNRFGCIAGDDVAIGIHCVIYPGRLIRSHTTFEPGIMIDKNYPGSTRYKKKQELMRISTY